MTQSFINHLTETLNILDSQGLTKKERPITSPQSTHISLSDNHRQTDSETVPPIINLCANNYLGLADHPTLITAAQSGLEKYGYGMASVRFICGTNAIHRDLEKQLALYLNKEDSILFACCFDANGGLFEPLLDNNDAIISDSLNHASIIDGVRLCKAKRYRYQHNDMHDLENQLIKARSEDARFIMIATDGVFSMDGDYANLTEITRLAKKYDALVMVDDCHATGFVGPKGAGTASHFNVDVDIITGTFGKALGGSIGGYIAGKQEVIDILRQKSRPYLFSNSLPPAIVTATQAGLELIKQADDLRKRLYENTRYWRKELKKLGFSLLEGEHPIIPIMVGDAQLSQNMAHSLLLQGVYVTGFFYPVVPMGKARIRTQMNATLKKDDLDFALNAFETTGKELNII